MLWRYGPGWNQRMTDRNGRSDAAAISSPSGRQTHELVDAASAADRVALLRHLVLRVCGGRSRCVGETRATQVASSSNDAVALRTRLEPTNDGSERAQRCSGDLVTVRPPNARAGRRCFSRRSRRATAPSGAACLQRALEMRRGDSRDASGEFLWRYGPGWNEQSQSPGKFSFQVLGGSEKSRFETDFKQFTWRRCTW